MKPTAPLPRLQARDADDTLQPDAIEKMLKRLADSRTNPEIADALGMTLSVVEKHRTTARKKLGLRTRAELIRVTTSHRWRDS